MISDQSARVLSNDIDRRKPSTSTSRKPLSQDIELCSCSGTGVWKSYEGRWMTLIMLWFICERVSIYIAHLVLNLKSEEL